MKRSPRVTGCTLLAALLLTLAPLAVAAQPADSVAAALERFAVDYEQDPMFRPATFGVEVEGDWWHVVAGGGVESEPASVQVVEGPPAEPTFYFTSDLATLGKLDRQEMNPMTAMAKAFSTDVTPFDLEVMEGFVPSGPDFQDLAVKTAIHFWNRGTPEIIPFGDALTRPAHGADAVLFYYQEGFRSGWGSIKPGQHANADPRSQVNPFPSLIIVTRGKGQARIGGVETTLEEGEALFIPPTVTHEFWNPYDAPMEIVLLMFGEGA